MGNYADVTSEISVTPVNDTEGVVAEYPVQATDERNASLAGMTARGGDLMRPFEPLTRPEGTVAFAGTVRADDGGVREFWVELAGRPRMYGEWRTKWTPNENDFDIEIVTFGFGSKHNVGDPFPGARNVFTIHEEKKVIDLVARLFSNVERRSGLSPFRGNYSLFLGNIIFMPGWIEVKYS